MRASTVVVHRGEAAVIPVPADVVGSPAPTLLFTLADGRNKTVKLWTGTPVAAGSPPTYSVTVPVELTNRCPETYWWDVWDMDTPRLLALGKLQIRAVVRLP